METHLIQFSAVIVGRAHNPSILNPDFLRSNGIVPAEWNWEVAETITTPPLAVVRYASGVTITAEHSKLQVVDVGDDPRPARSRVAAIARKYVDTLPHVPYVAVGNNFQSALPMENPGAFLRERFLQSGPWDSAVPSLAEAGIRLVFPVPGGRLVLSLDAGRAEELDGSTPVTKSVVLLNGNFHRECDEHPTRDQVFRHLDAAGQDYDRFQELAGCVLG